MFNEKGFDSPRAKKSVIETPSKKDLFSFEDSSESDCQVPTI